MIFDYVCVEYCEELGTYVLSSLLHLFCFNFFDSIFLFIFIIHLLTCIFIYSLIFIYFLFSIFFSSFLPLLFFLPGIEFISMWCPKVSQLLLAESPEGNYYYIYELLLSMHLLLYFNICVLTYFFYLVFFTLF